MPPLPRALVWIVARDGGVEGFKVTGRNTFRRLLGTGNGPNDDGDVPTCAVAGLFPRRKRASQFAAAPAEAVSQHGISGEPSDGAGESRRIRRRHKQSILTIPNYLIDRPDPCCNDRQARLHRFGQHNAVTLIQRWESE